MTRARGRTSHATTPARFPLGLTALLCAALASPAVRVEAADRPAPVRGTRAAALKQRLTAAEKLARRRFVRGLMAKLTLEQKVGQLNQGFTGPMTINPSTGIANTNLDDVRAGRLGSIISDQSKVEQVNALQKGFVEQGPHGIPTLFAYDAIHGYKTDYGINLGFASAFDPKLVRRIYRAMGREAAAHGINVAYSPMVDLVRGNAFWGRVMEGSGEDPLLGERIAAAAVRGLQEVGVAATVKHYMGYGANEGPDYSRTRIPPDEMADFARPFHAAVKAGAKGIMWAFNDLNGTPATGNQALDKLLRKRMKFEGVGWSDWGSIGEQIPHGVAADLREAAKRAIKAGVDIDMMSSAYTTHLADLVRSAKGKERRQLLKHLDQSVERVLNLKYDLGLFKDPYAATDRGHVILSPEHRRLARETAQKSIVLLKNDPHQGKQVLPLAATARKIAVVGPLADSQADPLGNWHAEAQAKDVVSVLQGIRTKAKARGTEVVHANGGTVEKSSAEEITAAAAAARDADVTVVVVGEGWQMVGEAQSRRTLGLPGDQQQLVDAIHATGKPYVVVLMNGRPLAIPKTAKEAPAILETWFAGTEAGNATADILFGDVNPSGKLPITFPRSEAQARGAYYNHRPTGRPALDADNEIPKGTPLDFRSRWYNDQAMNIDPRESAPLYPFGHGLSYTRFEYSDLKLSSKQVGPKGKITIQATIKNAGDRAGEEVVQLYLGDVVRSTTPPVKELKDFQRVRLKPGESRTVEFTVGPKQLAFLDANLKAKLEPGQFRVWVAPSSAGGLKDSFELVEQ